MKLHLLIFFLLTICPASLFAAGKQSVLRPDSVGVVYLAEESAKSLDLEIVFPAKQAIIYPDSFSGADYKATAPVLVEGQLVLFDAKGPLATIKSHPQFYLRFWCENDGGTQFRPEVKMTITKSLLKRPLKANKELQGIAAFVFVKSARSNVLTDTMDTDNRDVRLKGDLLGNGHIKALIWVAPDEAGNCDGKPENNLTIHLKTSSMDSALRCCGP